MTDDRTPTDSAPSDRRVHTKVREVFTQACALLAPHILDTQTPVSGLTLARMVRNHFPELEDGDVHVLISAVQRLRDEQRLRAVLDGQSGQ